MSKFAETIIAGICSLVLVGCTTVTKPVPLSKATAVPPSRLYAFQAPTLPNGGTLAITRDQGFGCYTALYINDKLAARFGNAESATFHVKPGEVVLRYGRDPQGKALCGAMQDHWATHETTLAPNQTKHYRLTIIRGGVFKIQRSD